MTLQLHVTDDPLAVPAREWNALLANQGTPTPFMRHEYLAALHASGSAVPATGWMPRFVLLRDAQGLAAACPLYVKSHSWGEYVFDFAWARAYAQHGLDYYPKAVVAAPFTPVPGSRLLARDDAARAALAHALVQWCGAQGLSSLHVLMGDEADLRACAAAGLMPRQQVQFHWRNRHPETGGRFGSFEEFLGALSHDKRKKIRQERRRVAASGVRFRHAQGRDITGEDWDFFYRCHVRTYLEHGQRPYLQPGFFKAMARHMPEAWVMFVAELEGAPIACSLIATNLYGTCLDGHFEPTAYGRYWGALQRVDRLHFEACYYQPIEWCIRQGIAHFEGGAQGEHKMARALMPTATHSAHWLAHPAFADAVQDFLQEEGRHLADYQAYLQAHTPFRQHENAAAGTAPDAWPDIGHAADGSGARA